MKKIIHVDLDYFFAQVELLDRPELRDKPVAIGYPSKYRGVLSTSNYVARKYGVRSAMSNFEAYKLCPQLIVLKSNMSKYVEMSEKVFDIFYRYSTKVEKVSVDEAYIDVTECEEFSNSASLIAKAIREDIFLETGLTASAGISYNKFLSKIASELNKPNGQFTIAHENLGMIQEFPVKYINGVGKKTLEKMHAKNIYTFSDLEKFSLLDLNHYFGKFGKALYDFARGIDEREVKTSRTRKSISKEKTFTPTDELTNIFIYLNEVYERLERRISLLDYVSYKGIFLKIKYADFKTYTIEEKGLEFNFENYKDLFFTKYNIGRDIRLLGLGVRLHVKDESDDQLTLSFDD